MVMKNTFCTYGKRGFELVEALHNSKGMSTQKCLILHESLCMFVLF